MTPTINADVDAVLATLSAYNMLASRFGEIDELMKCNHGIVAFNRLRKLLPQTPDDDKRNHSTDGVAVWEQA